MLKHWMMLAAAMTLAMAPIGAVRAQEAGPPLPPLPYKVLKELRSDPQKWEQFRAAHSALPPAPPAEQQQPPGGAIPPAAPLAWTSTPWNLQLSNPVLLTDGTVMAHVSCTSTWWRLTPNSSGSYYSGTWRKTAPLPSGYAPRFFSSAVLSDGRLLIEGGEYNGAGCNDVETNRGAIYDPQKDSWTAVPAPKGWKEIGDASGIVLANGKYLLSTAADNQLATLDPATLTWTVTNPSKAEPNNEENWTLLPNGFVLAIEAYANGSACSDGSMVFQPLPGTWAAAGNTINKLNSCSGSIQNFEGPTQILSPDGTVFAFSAAASTAAQDLPTYTALYDASAKTWAAGPKMPVVNNQYYDMPDAPAAIMPDGSALIATSPAVWANASSYPAPTHFFIFNGSQFTRVGDVKDSAQLSAYEMNFLILPTGNILAVETDLTKSEIFPAATNFTHNAAWAPVVTSISASGKILTRGQSYSLSGRQLSGLTQGAVYGDDVQADTNFPLVRIVNNASGHVVYARTSNFSRTVAPSAVSSVDFAVPASAETGASKLYVIVNGAASNAVAVTVN
jgi:hypothetical protein